MTQAEKSVFFSDNRIGLCEKEIQINMCAILDGYPDRAVGMKIKIILKIIQKENLFTVIFYSQFSVQMTDSLHIQNLVLYICTLVWLAFITFVKIPPCRRSKKR